MNDYNYQVEFYLALDKRCQAVIDGCYAILRTLKHYKEDCCFELPIQYEKFQKNIFNMLKNYEEIDR